MKSYRKRDIISAAVHGEQVEVVQYLLKKIYRGRTPKEDAKIKKDFKSNRDVEGDTFLHFMYRVNVPEITSIIKEAGLLIANENDEKLLMNLRGQIPEE